MEEFLLGKYNMSLKLKKEIFEMSISFLICFGVCLLGGCKDSSSDSFSVQHKAQEYVNGWTNMGVYLPAKQVSFFEVHFNDVQSILVEALEHSNPDVRMRAAYIIENLSEKAITLEFDILRALESESTRVVRLYLYGALRAIGARENVTINALKERFALLAIDGNDFMDKNERYTNVDEQIYVAATLYVLDDDLKARPNYLSAVLKWLESPETKLYKEDMESYWNHRLCAVDVVEHMNGATEAIPLLKAMLSEQPQKPWVSSHVPRVLDALEGNK